MIFPRLKPFVCAALVLLSCASLAATHAQTEAPVSEAPVSEAEAAQTEAKTVAPDDYVALRLKLRVGQMFRMTQTSQVKSVVVSPATNNRAAQKTESWSNDSVTTLLRVLDIEPNGDYRVRVTYEDVRNEPLAVINGVRSAPIASVEKLADAMNDALKNRSLEMTLTPLGNVADVRGLNEFWSAMNAAFEAAGLSAAEQKTAGANVRNTFNENALRDTMEQSGMAFPGHLVRVGEAWFADLKLRGALPFATKVQRTLQSRSDDTLTIIENGTLKLANAQLTVPETASRFGIEMQGTYTGTTSLDAKTSFARLTQLTQRYSGTVSAFRNGVPLQTSSLYGRVFTKTTAEEVR